jgi:hypothetical protein
MVILLVLPAKLAYTIESIILIRLFDAVLAVHYRRRSWLDRRSGLEWTPKAAFLV